MKSYLTASLGALVLAAGIANAAPNTPPGSTTRATCEGSNCGFRKPTHGHHAKVKPGQKNEDGLSTNWPGPHPGIGGGDRGQMGDGSVRTSTSGARALPSGQRALPAGQRLGQ